MNRPLEKSEIGAPMRTGARVATPPRSTTTRAGVTVTLLDFGARAISLPQLKDVVPDRVKLHRSFVRGVVHEPEKMALARSLIHTKEVKGASVLNNGFNAGFPGGDGVALFSTAHPLAGGGTLSNTLATPADLSEAALEEILILMGEWTDDRGIPIRAQATKLIVPTELQFIATRLLMTPYQPDTGDNNINAMYKLGSIRDGFAVNHRLTDPDAWFIKTDVPDGMKHFVRKAVSGGVEGDFETGNMRYKKRERYSFGYTDWRGMVASAGA